jgi:hypothetical protein
VRVRAPIVVGIVLVLPLIGAVSSAQEPERESAAFRAVASVLQSPRCVNCHIPGDAPLQGDAGRPHVMRVKRGADGRGTPAVRCRACHLSENAQTLHGPPGASNWRLPSPSTRMAWQGLSGERLCQALKDPVRTGGRSLAQLVEHVRDDHLVRWGWEPGPGRSLPPISHERFVAAFESWVRDGAPCPPSSGRDQ